MPVAFLFPGQNSRYPEMIHNLVKRDPSNAETLDRASEVLNRDLRVHFEPGNDSMFVRNRDVQIGVFLANHMYWQMLDRAGVKAEYSAGLSLGEFNHLVHIGALSFEDALRILSVRGDAYDDAPRGKMMAIFPVSAECVSEMVAENAQEKVSIGMYNTPQQCVLSGDRAAVDLMSDRIAEAHFAQSVVVDDRLPMHSPLFRFAGEAIRPQLEAARWSKPARFYLSNVRGDFVRDPSPEEFVQLLALHPWNAVRWRQCMEKLIAISDQMVFVEVGPKSVLTRFFARRWFSPRRYSTDSEGGISELVAQFRNLADGHSRIENAD